MIDNHTALAAVVRHAVECADDYDDIAPTVEALMACGDTTLVPELHQALDRFLDEENFYGRDLIAGILAGIEGVAALPALLRASARDLGDDQDSLCSEISGLLHADPTAARRTVLEFAGSDMPELRRAGLWALGYVVQAQDVELLAAAATDADPEVRSLAIGSILDPAGHDRAFEMLVRALGDQDEQVRVSAVSRLGYTGRADAVTPLVAVAGDTESQVRSMVAYALGRLGSAEATPVLLRLQRDVDRHVRERAVEALGSIGGPAAVDALLALAVDEDPRLRAQAAKALPKAAGSDPQVMQQLTVLGQDDEAAVRAATVSGFASAGDRSSQGAPLVVGLANDPEPMVRQRVAVVARLFIPDAAPEILRRYSSDPDPVLRRIAGAELGRLNDSTAR